MHARRRRSSRRRGKARRRPRRAAGRDARTHCRDRGPARTREELEDERTRRVGRCGSPSRSARVERVRSRRARARRRGRALARRDQRRRARSDRHGSLRSRSPCSRRRRGGLARRRGGLRRSARGSRGGGTPVPAPASFARSASRFEATWFSSLSACCAGAACDGTLVSLASLSRAASSWPIAIWQRADSSVRLVADPGAAGALRDGVEARERRAAAAVAVLHGLRGPERGVLIARARGAVELTRGLGEVARTIRGHAGGEAVLRIRRRRTWSPAAARWSGCAARSRDRRRRTVRRQPDARHSRCPTCGGGAAARVGAVFFSRAPAPSSCSCRPSPSSPALARARCRTRSLSSLRVAVAATLAGGEAVDEAGGGCRIGIGRTSERDGARGARDRARSPVARSRRAAP